MDEWVCYLIMSLDSNDTYIGSTNNLENRLYNHNRPGKYGAKRTRGQTWVPILFVSGFPSKISCLSFEAGWKRLARTRSNYKLDIINSICDTNVCYIGRDSRWNRIVDLLYFVHSSEYITEKFRLSLGKVSPFSDIPPTLIIHLFLEDWLKDLHWAPHIIVKTMRIKT